MDTRTDMMAAMRRRSSGNLAEFLQEVEVDEIQILTKIFPPVSEHRMDLILDLFTMNGYGHRRVT